MLYAQYASSNQAALGDWTQAHYCFGAAICGGEAQWIERAGVAVAWSCQLAVQYLVGLRWVAWQGIAGDGQSSGGDGEN